MYHVADVYDDVEVVTCRFSQIGAYPSQPREDVLSNEESTISTERTMPPRYQHIRYKHHHIEHVRSIWAKRERVDEDPATLPQSRLMSWFC
jgi:hypothetical protein